MIKILQIIAYIIIQLALLPTSIIAVVIINFKAIVLSKKNNVDYTAVKVLQLRCKMHLLGVRHDIEAVNLYKELPMASYYGLLLLLAPIKFANFLIGYKSVAMRIPKKETTSISQYIYTRTLEFDRILNANISKVDQIVVMGAGFDLRAIKHANKMGVRVYELDQKPILNLKQKYLNKIKLQCNSVINVAVDFNKDSWSDMLIENGFDVNKKTFFLWEGVASYLDEKTVISTLQNLKFLFQKKSIVSFDYNSTLYNQAKGSFMENTIVNLMKITGKVFLFGIDTVNAEESAERFLAKCDLQLMNLTLIGRNTKTIHPFSGVIEAMP